MSDEPRTNGPADLGWTPEATGRAPLRFPIPHGARACACFSCKARIFWIRTPAGRAMPVDPDGTSHFATCPHASRHRRRA